MLNPAWLKTFKTLVETGHFTKTADKLFMTQPGVSQHVKKLESSCGHALIVRHKKQFEITEQGLLVYEHAKEIETREAGLIEKLNFDDPYSGVCQLSCSGSIALRIYPKLLDLQVAHPQLSIQLEVAPNHKILEGVKSGHIDLGIVTNQPDNKLFSAEAIGTDELCLITPKNFDATGDVQHALRSLGLICHPDALHYLSLYFSQCGIDELANTNVNDIPIAGDINQLVQILIPVTKGLGFTVLPRSAFEYYPDNALLQVLESPSRVLETLMCVKARFRQLPARCDNIASHLKAIISRA